MGLRPFVGLLRTKELIHKTSRTLKSLLNANGLIYFQDDDDFRNLNWKELVEQVTAEGTDSDIEREVVQGKVLSGIKNRSAVHIFDDISNDSNINYDLNEEKALVISKSDLINVLNDDALTSQKKKTVRKKKEPLKNQLISVFN